MLRAAALVHERLRHAAAHREALPERGPEVRRREREELLVGVQPVAVLAREHPADGGRFDRAEQEAGHRQRQQQVQILWMHGAQAEARQALGHRAEQRDAAGVEPEERDGGDAGHEHDERHGPVREPALAREQQRERGEPERE